MKNIITVILSILFVLSVTSISLAVEEGKPDPTMLPKLMKLPGVAKVQQITGQIRAVNADAMTITVTKKIRDKVIEAIVTVDDKTKITKENVEKTFSDMKIGENVIVKYTKVDKKNIAKRIAIKPTEPESKK